MIIYFLKHGEHQNGSDFILSCLLTAQYAKVIYYLSLLRVLFFVIIGGIVIYRYWLY
jgi:hypothetical protein